MILALHSSPVPDGNLARMTARTARASGLDVQCIALAKLDIRPCDGCVRCAATRRCAQADGMAPLYETLEKAQGLVLGGVNYNGRMNAVAHLFLERLFPLYHLRPALRGLPAAVVAVGGEQPERAARDMAGYLGETWFCRVVGAATFRSDTPPCFRCGHGPDCPVGMPALHWPQAAFDDFTKVRPDMFQQFEDNQDAARACDRVGQALGAAVRGEDRERPRSGGGYWV